MVLLSHWRKNSANRASQQPLSSTHHIHDAIPPVSGTQALLCIRGCWFTARLFWRSHSFTTQGFCSERVAYAHAIRFTYSRLYSDANAHSDSDTGVPDQNSPEPNANSNRNTHTDSYARS